MNKKPSKFSPEVLERAVRLVREQRSEHPSLWAAIESIAPMIGCTSQTLHGCARTISASMSASRSATYTSRVCGKLAAVSATRS